MPWLQWPPSHTDRAPALKLIKVDYEVLPHVTDVEAAMSHDAPVLHDKSTPPA